MVNLPQLSPRSREGIGLIPQPGSQLASEEQFWERSEFWVSPVKELSGGQGFITAGLVWWTPSGRPPKCFLCTNPPPNPLGYAALFISHVQQPRPKEIKYPAVPSGGAGPTPKGYELCSRCCSRMRTPGAQSSGGMLPAFTLGSSAQDCDRVN